jgi:hypothetical protein
MRLAKLNISAGLLFMAGFMLYGFVPVYLRDFAPLLGVAVAGLPS